MGIGLGVVLLLIGLDLRPRRGRPASSVNNVVDTNTLGWILIIVGALAIVLALVMNAQRSPHQPRGSRSVGSTTVRG